VKRAFLLAAVLLALGASGARAAPFGPAEEQAYAEAEAFWGREPTLCTTIRKEVVPPGSIDAFGEATMPTGPMPCELLIAEGLSGEFLCSIVRHEYGHLLGLDHPEMMSLPACGSTGVLGEDVLRRQGWEEWRETRDECRGARGSYRPKCWRQLKRDARKLRDDAH
jgi:hypothetical protein